MKPVIKQYNDMDSKVWDDFVYNCRGGYAYYLYDVIALDRWINDKNRSFCIINEENGKIVLIAMLHLEKRVTQNDEFYRLHSRWGTIIDDNLTVKEKKRYVVCINNISILWLKNIVSVALMHICRL